MAYSNQDTLAKATKELMLKEPFYGLFLITMNKVWRNDLDTAGVSKNGINVQLAINPIFWENLSHEFKVGILKHELLHIAFHHLTMRDKYSDKKLFNIAADLEINQYIDKAYLPGANYPSKEEYEKDIKIFIDAIKEGLKKGEMSKEEAHNEILKIPMRGIMLDDYAELNLKAKGGTDYYYNELKKTMDQNGNSSCQALQDAMGPAPDDRGDSPWDHKTWKDFDGISEAEKKLIQKQVDYQLQETANQIQKSRGTIPGELQGYIDELNKIEPPKFNWKAYLRNFVGGSTQTDTKKTRRKFSKRFKGSPGLKITERLHVLVGVDTSGSVSTRELAEFFHEMHHMFKTGTEITVVQCDTQISNIQKYRSSDDGKIKLYGRGGTSFDPVVDYFNENRRKFSCLIYFTDGEAPAPQNMPSGRTLWVLSTQSGMTDHLPGKTIKLN